MKNPWFFLPLARQVVSATLPGVSSEVGRASVCVSDSLPVISTAPAGNSLPEGSIAKQRRRPEPEKRILPNIPNDTHITHTLCVCCLRIQWKTSGGIMMWCMCVCVVFLWEWGGLVLLLTHCLVCTTASRVCELLEPSDCVWRDNYINLLQSLMRGTEPQPTVHVAPKSLLGLF